MEIHEATRRMSHYRWLEEQLFEVMGAWAATTPEPAVKRYFATQCHRHAWHAGLWQDRLPVLPGADAGADTDGLASSVPADLTALVEALASPLGPDSTIERLAGVCRVVLPRLVAAYHAHLVSTDERIDGPTHRVLTLALRDEEAAWKEGELALQTLLHTPDDVGRAAVHQARLEGLLVSGPSL